MTGRRDIIGIGVSTGGIEALVELVRGLPAGLPAAVLVVIHLPAGGDDALLPALLRYEGALPVSYAHDGEVIRPGRILLARPDQHLIVDGGGGGRVRLWRGPRENRVRPAIDPLFRTASETFGDRVVGVILSGTLDDGAAGLAAVKRRGGVAIVQDPAEALFPILPQHVLKAVAPDHVLPAAAIGPLLARLAQEAEQESHA